MPIKNEFWPQWKTVKLQDGSTLKVKSERDIIIDAFKEILVAASYKETSDHQTLYDALDECQRITTNILEFLDQDADH